MMRIRDNVFGDLSESNHLGKRDPDLIGKSEKIKNLPAKNDVYERVKYLLVHDEYNVQLVNSDQDVSSLLDDEGQLELTQRLNRFIGGFVLDRGITINHLLGFFYGREPQTKQQASVLQHCRMYGNRSLNDMAVTRLYATESLYTCLKKVNDMDDMMKAKFEKTVNDPNADPSIEFIICDKKNGIIPCSKSSIALSKTTVWKSGSFVKSKGMVTIDSTRKLTRIVDSIQDKFKGKTEKVVFEMDVKTAISMVKQAVDQFQYSRDLENIEEKWDGSDMIELLNRLAKNGKVLAYTRTKCNTSRLREDGGFIDAPVDGQEESPYIKSKAVDKPVLLMLLNKGNLNGGKGWSGNPFYWPVLCLLKNMESIMYCPR